MAHVRTNALVLKRTDFSETSLVLALLTERHGRCSVLVKGAKRPKSPFFGALDLYSLNEVVILQRHSSGLALLTEASSIQQYRGMRRNLKNAYAAHAVAELLLGLIHEAEPVDEVFNLTCRTFSNLAEVGPEQIGVYLAMFQVHLLRQLGLELVLDRCVLCEKPICETVGGIAISVTAGGAVCTECVGRAHETVKVSLGAVKVLAVLGGGASANMVARMRVSGRIAVELRTVLTRAYTHLLGRVPKMVRFLHGESLA